MFLFAMLAVVLFPGRIQASKFHGPPSGSGGGLSESADWSAWPEPADQADASFGVSVGTAGDVNGDGISDVIVGAYGENKVYVFHGSDSDAGMSTTADWTADFDQLGAYWGFRCG